MKAEKRTKSKRIETNPIQLKLNSVLKLSETFECIYCKKVFQRDLINSYMVCYKDDVIMIDFFCPECVKPFSGYEFEYIFFKE